MLGAGQFVRYAAQGLADDIVLATSSGDAPSASNDCMIRSMETLGSPASIVAVRDGRALV